MDQVSFAIGYCFVKNHEILPGASSMFGIMAELGPLIVNDESLLTDEYNRTSVPSLFYNEYGWSKVGGLLMFDWPPPVGDPSLLCDASFSKKYYRQDFLTVTEILLVMDTVVATGRTPEWPK